MANRRQRHDSWEKMYERMRDAQLRRNQKARQPVSRALKPADITARIRRLVQTRLTVLQPGVWYTTAQLGRIWGIRRDSAYWWLKIHSQLFETRLDTKRRRSWRRTENA